MTSPKLLILGVAEVTSSLELPSSLSSKHDGNSLGRVIVTVTHPRSKENNTVIENRFLQSVTLAVISEEIFWIDVADTKAPYSTAPEISVSVATMATTTKISPASWISSASVTPR